MFKPKCPCNKECPDRSVHCRDNCEKFKEYYEKYQQYRSEIEANRKESLEYYDYKSKILKKPMQNIYRRKARGRVNS